MRGFSGEIGDEGRRGTRPPEGPGRGSPLRPARPQPHQRATVQQLGVDPDIITSDVPDTLETCRQIADLARSAGFAAIRYPSAAAEGEENLVLFSDTVSPQATTLEENDRRPLNYN